MLMAPRPQWPSRGALGPLEAGALGQRSDRLQQAPRVDWLVERLLDVHLRRLDRALPVRGDDDHGDVRDGRERPLQRSKLQPVHVRHHEVEDDHGWFYRSGVEAMEGLETVSGALDGVALAREQLGERSPEDEVVLDEEDGARAGR